MSQKGEPACLFKVITWYESRSWSHLQAIYSKCSKYWTLVSLQMYGQCSKDVSQFRISITIILDFTWKSMTNSLGHLSKLCQVFHLMICVTLGVFFPLFIWHFLSKPCMVPRWQCSHEESLPYQESLCNLGSKERFFCLRQSLWLPAFPFLSIRSWGCQSTFCWGQRLCITRWTCTSLHLTRQLLHSCRRGVHRRLITRL